MKRKGNAEAPSRTEAGAAGARPEQPGAAYVVGIGASAGGLEALERFFEGLPPDGDIAFVVIQHLSPDYKGAMVELLSRKTRMPVVRSEDGMPVEGGRVYLIPAGHNLTIFHRKLVLTEQEIPHGLNLPVDVFLRSLAEDVGERGIAVILSGTGSDGMRGVRAVKESGGLVLVQEEGTAQFDGMPRSAISTGLTDRILPPEKMGTEIHRILKQAPTLLAPATARLAAEGEPLTKILSVLRRSSGIDFGAYKPTTILRRIERRMSIHGIAELDEYHRFLNRSEQETATLHKELLIGVTYFFRDSPAWQCLREKAVHDLVASADKDGQVRAWVAGCSTGEEAYSLAMLFQEEAEAQEVRCSARIFATDIDKDAIDLASAGVYPESIVAELSAERLGKYFVRTGERYQVQRALREMVVFAPQNLLRDPPFSRMDLVTCRNLLIYLKPEFQKKIVSLFGFALRAQGTLFLGAAETLGELSDHFQTLDTRWKIYRSRTTSRQTFAETLALPATGPGAHLRPRAMPPNPLGTSRGDRLNQRLWEAISSGYLPPGLAVNEDGDPVHVFGDIGKYFRIPPGTATFNALKMAHPDLGLVLSTALSRVVKEGGEVVYRDVHVGKGDDRTMLDLRVQALPDSVTGQRIFLIFLESARAQPSQAERPGEVFAPDEETRRRITDLEQELQYTKENLQTTIEELETSNEELQATNEELLASNEELQSKYEELQSVNEEIYTVNAEHQRKIQEMTELSADMDNFLVATRVGTLFLDRDLKIRKFTPSIADELHILPQDVGRPFQHLAHALEYPRFLDDARRVLKELAPVETEVRSGHGRSFLVRIVPYRGEADAVQGVVITLVDISDLREGKRKIAKLEKLVRQGEKQKVRKPRRRSPVNG